jgi:hypothetical protein
MNQISKSDYMLFLKHPAWLWVKKNDPAKIPPVDDNTQAMFDAGNKFEQFAESLFPEGVSLGFSDYDEYRSLPQRTIDAIDRGDQVLFQPRFEYKEFTCISDIMSFVGDKEVDLYEIKASTRAKTEHEYDLAFQVAVIEGCGYRVRNISVIHVDNTYVRNGPIEADKITKITDVTSEVKARRSKTHESMAEALKVASSDTMPDPDPSHAKLGSKADWLKIYANIVPQNPVVFPEDTRPTIQREHIIEFIENLQYPLYFLDYETLMGLVPYFDGQRPYQQVPFQYSLHILDAPDAPLRHEEYLHRENSNPAASVVAAMQSHFGDKGSVIAWNMGFEKSCNNTLMHFVPEAAEFLADINNRMVDLMIPFSQNYYVDADFCGSASIKNVLPVLVPELSYKTLDIQEGGTAQRLWMEAALDGKHPEEKAEILSDLIAYCKLDTFAMVEIYNVLRKI